MNRLPDNAIGNVDINFKIEIPKKNAEVEKIQFKSVFEIGLFLCYSYIQSHDFHIISITTNSDIIFYL